MKLEIKVSISTLFNKKIICKDTQIMPTCLPYFNWGGGGVNFYKSNSDFKNRWWNREDQYIDDDDDR